MFQKIKHENKGPLPELHSFSTLPELPLGTRNISFF